MDNNAIEENLDELNSKHRKEKKELQSQIQSLKKSAAKGDKKKRKEILEEISRLEIDLEKRQATQLNEFQNQRNSQTTQQSSAEEIAVEAVTNDFISLATNDLDNQPRLTKAQKRRNKKASEEKQREAEILASEEENKNGPRMREHCAIAEILKSRQLKLHSIASDGDCLYKAVAHQLELTGRGAFTIAELRQKTAKYILENKDHLIFYMTNSNTGEILTDDDFKTYCQNILTTASWGGQVEIKALSSALQVPIEVIQATGPSTIQGSEYEGPNLVVTYHRLMYSLGEHYNSTKPRPDNDTDENDDEFEKEESKIDV